MYRTMVTARLVDEAAFRLNRQGKAPFVVPVSGHEGCQVGTAWPLRPGQDIWVPYYRDVAVVLIAGMTPYEIFLGLFAKAEDPSSGGRQMPSHWGSRRLGIISHSSPIATQVPHAAGIAYAARYRGEDAVVGCWFGVSCCAIASVAHSPHARIPTRIQCFFMSASLSLQVVSDRTARSDGTDYSDITSHQPTKQQARRTP